MWYEKVLEHLNVNTSLLDYWDSYPEIPVEDWRYEVSSDSTRVGYWEFVAMQLGLTEI